MTFLDLDLLFQIPVLFQVSGACVTDSHQYDNMHTEGKNALQLVQMVTTKLFFQLTH